MPPKRGMKRVISDEEDDDFAPAAETAENPEESTRPARKTRKTIASKATAPTQDSDAEEPDEITQPARKTRKTAAPTPRDNSEQTSRQRASKTGLHAPAQNPDLGPRQSTNKAARQVSTTSKRSLSNQSSAKRGTTYQEVFAKTSLTNIERQKNWIKELIMARRRERTGTAAVPSEQSASSETTTQRKPAASTPDIPHVPLPSDVVRLVDHLFTDSPIPGRNWSGEIEEYTAPKPAGLSDWARNWVAVPRVLFWLVDNTGKGKAKKRWVGTARITTQMDVPLARRIASDIALAANRFPGEVNDLTQAKVGYGLNMKSEIAKLILEAATRRQGGRRVLRAPSLQLANKGLSYNMNYVINFIDPKTHKECRFMSNCEAIQAESISVPYFPMLQWEVPSYPPSALNRTLSVRTQNGRDVHESVLPATLPELTVPWTSTVTKHAAISHAEQVARALVATLDGLVINKPGMKRLVKQYAKSFGNAFSQKAPLRPGTYGGVKLFSVKRDVGSRRSRINPSSAVRRDIDPTVGRGRLPIITIKSIDLARVTPVLDALVQAWADTGKILEAWIACAEAAHGANTDIDNGVLAQPVCRLIGSDDSCVLDHVCSSCGNTFPCEGMIDGVLGFRVCSPCDVADRKKWPLGMAFKAALDRLKQMLYRDFKNAKIEKSDKRFQNTLEEASQQLEAWFKERVQPGAKWVDGYSDKERVQAGEKPSGLFKKDAFAISIDAAFPYGISAAGLLQHLKDNFVLCPLTVNFAKWIHLPAWLSFLSRHLSLYDAYRAGERNDDTDRKWKAHQIQLIGDAKELAALRAKAHFQLIYRKNHIASASAERIALDRDEWRSGKFHNFDKSGNKDRPWHKERGRIRAIHYDDLENPEEQAINLHPMRFMVHKIETEFKVKLRRGKIDDCPWFCDDDPPEGWSWPMCNALIGDVLARLKEWCNGLHPTRDPPECIFIEIIFIVCIWGWKDKGSKAEEGKLYHISQKQFLQKKYSEFLGLPIVYAIKNPLCFAITHRVHGNRTLTGWDKKKAPTELELHDRDDSTNNMLIETQTSNWSKSNFDTKHYGGIKNMLRDVKHDSLGPDVPDSQGTGLFGQWFEPKMPPIKKVKKSLQEDLLEVDEDEGFDFKDDMEAMGVQVEFQDEDVDEDEDKQGDSDDDGSDGDEEGDDEGDKAKAKSKGKARRISSEVEQGDEAVEEAVSEEAARLTNKYLEAHAKWEKGASKHFKLDIFKVLLQTLYDAAQTGDSALYDQEEARIEEFIKTQKPTND